MVYLPVLLAALLAGAHFLRADSPGLTAACLAAPGLLLIRRRWVVIASTVLLAAATAVWIDTAVDLVRARQAAGAPWARLATILGGVAALTAATALVFGTRTARRRFAAAGEHRTASATAFLVTVGALAIVQLVVDRPLLLLERFWRGGGWLEVLALGTYAAWVTEKMLDPGRQPTVRRRIWLLFSAVFFAQLVLGLAGIEKLLMTGELHLPVPAMIAAGPLFRGDGMFMPILFLATVLLVGPAWCSHLCYIGAWDHAAAAASGRKRPRPLSGWTRHLRVGLLVLVVGTAVGLRLTGASALLATWLAAGFGLAGVALMLLWSRRTGAMAHCVVFCPMGLLADLFGKLSVFRLRIADGCTDCLKCTRACRYDALNLEDIARRRPGLTCTLCGDCLGTCEDRQIEYVTPFGRGAGARAAFVAVAVAAHAAFLGVARI